MKTITMILLGAIALIGIISILIIKFYYKDEENEELNFDEESLIKNNKFKKDINGENNKSTDFNKEQYDEITRFSLNVPSKSNGKEMFDDYYEPINGQFVEKDMENRIMGVNEENRRLNNIGNKQEKEIRRNVDNLVNKELNNIDKSKTNLKDISERNRDIATKITQVPMTSKQKSFLNESKKRKIIVDEDSKSGIKIIKSFSNDDITKNSGFEKRNIDVNKSPSEFKEKDDNDSILPIKKEETQNKKSTKEENYRYSNDIKETIEELLKESNIKKTPFIEETINEIVDKNKEPKNEGVVQNKGITKEDNSKDSKDSKDGSLEGVGADGGIVKDDSLKGVSTEGKITKDESINIIEEKTSCENKIGSNENENSEKREINIEFKENNIDEDKGDLTSKSGFGEEPVEKISEEIIAEKEGDDKSYKQDTNSQISEKKYGGIKTRETTLDDHYSQDYNGFMKNTDSLEYEKLKKEEMNEDMNQSYPTKNSISGVVKSFKNLRKNLFDEDNGNDEYNESVVDNSFNDSYEDDDDFVSITPLTEDEIKAELMEESVLIAPIDEEENIIELNETFEDVGSKKTKKDLKTIKKEEAQKEIRKLREKNTEKIFSTLRTQNSNMEVTKEGIGKVKPNNNQVIIGGKIKELKKGQTVIFNFNNESYSSKILATKPNHIGVKYRGKNLWIKNSRVKKVLKN